MSSQQLKTDTTLDGLEKFKYTLPETRKTIKQRRRVTFLSQIKAYNPEDVIQIDFSSSQEFMYGPSSYLAFDVNMTQIAAQANATLPTFTDVKDGSFCNLLTEFKCTIKSSEVEYTRGLDSLTYIKDQYACSDQYLSSTGTLQGYKRGQIGSGIDELKTTKHTVVVPLHHISTFFSQDIYLPLPQLGQVSLEIKLNNYLRAFKMGAAQQVGTTFTVTDVKLVADMYHVSDFVLAASRNASREGKMILGYDAYYYNKSSVGIGQTTNTIEIKKSVTKAMSVISRIRDNPANAAAENLRNTQASQPWDAENRWQYMLGSESYPVRPVSNNVESMAISLDAFHVLDNCVRPPTVNLATFGTELGIMAVDLERDISNHESSAVSTKDNARILFEVNTNGAAVVGSYVETWLHYLRGLIVMPTSVSIKE